MVKYNDCLEAVKQHAAKNPGYHSTLRISQAPCNGLRDEQSCFVGCQYGGKSGGIYTFLLSDVYEEFKAYNQYRCKFAIEPYCLCGNAAPPPPYAHPPPPPTLYQEDWVPVSMPPNTDAFKGKISALIKRVVRDIRFEFTSQCKIPSAVCLPCLFSGQRKDDQPFVARLQAHDLCAWPRRW
jgi:hypothetical protein